MAKLGFRRLDEMVGRVDMIDPRHLIIGRQRASISQRCCTSPRFPMTSSGQPRVHELQNTLDGELITRSRPALEEGQPVSFEVPVRNLDRAVGAMLGAEVSRRHGASGLPDETIKITFKGSAGQSFGAFALWDQPQD